eukprot:m.101947 g.101947  ORF g.101947 m.101947 type:complete len:543 (+) comp15482_c0_seq2:523-2151(+)
MPCLHRCLQHASGDTLAATLTSLRWLVRGRLVTKAMFAVELVNEVLSTARQRSCDPRVQVEACRLASAACEAGCLDAHALVDIAVELINTSASNLCTFAAQAVGLIGVCCANNTAGALQQAACGQVAHWARAADTVCNTLRVASLVCLSRLVACGAAPWDAFDDGAAQCLLDAGLPIASKERVLRAMWGLVGTAACGTSISGGQGEGDDGRCALHPGLAVGGATLAAIQHALDNLLDCAQGATAAAGDGTIVCGDVQGKAKSSDDMVKAQVTVGCLCVLGKAEGNVFQAQALVCVLGKTESNVFQAQPLVATLAHCFARVLAGPGATVWRLAALHLLAELPLSTADGELRPALTLTVPLLAPCAAHVCQLLASADPALRLAACGVLQRFPEVPGRQLARLVVGACVVDHATACARLMVPVGATPPRCAASDGSPTVGQQVVALVALLRALLALGLGPLMRCHRGLVSVLHTLCRECREAAGAAKDTQQGVADVLRHIASVSASSATTDQGVWRTVTASVQRRTTVAMLIAAKHAVVEQSSVA